MKNLLGILFMCIFLFSSCGKKISESDIQHIKNGFWKYNYGYYVGDFVYFNNNSYKLHCDTLVHNNSNIGIIKEVNSSRLIVKSMDSKKEGEYILK
jgi:hypothetical protein